MIHRCLKFIRNTTHIMLIFLLFELLRGQLGVRFSAGALFLSALYLGLTYLTLEQLLRSYFSTVSRLVFRFSLGTGVLLDIPALISGPSTIRIIAVLELLGWLCIYGHYLRHQRQFVKQGHGPLPKDAAINVPIDMLQAGDLIITGGRLVQGVPPDVLMTGN